MLGIQPIEAEYIFGPFSNGKTVVVSKLYELQRLRMSESKIFVAASSNSACDAVVPKFASLGLMVVRAHALSLERETLLRPHFKARRCGKLAEADPLPENYEPIQPTQAAPKQRTIEIDGAEMIQRAESAHEKSVPDQDDDKEGRVIDQNIEDEAVDNGSPEILHHADFLVLFFG